MHLPRWHRSSFDVYTRQLTKLAHTAAPAVLRQRVKKRILRASLICAFCYTLSRYFCLPDPPLFLTGEPVDGVQPGGYFGQNRRFVLYNNWYGQFNNQIISLINALSIARGIGGVLVLPSEKLGKESIHDSKHIKMRRLFSMREVVGAYFNYSLLASAAPVVRPSDFLASIDGRQLLARRTIVTEFKSGGYYRFLFTGTPRGELPGAPSPNIWSPKSTRPRLSDWCDFRAAKALTHVQKLFQHDRFVLLPTVFRHFNLNCTQFDHQWLSIRRFIRPRDEILHAVDAFMQNLPKPIFAIHLRLFRNGDLDNFTPRSVIEMLRTKFSHHMQRANTIFLAYTPSSVESIEILKLLKSEFQGTVVGGEQLPNFLPGDSRNIRKLPLHSVLLDMWVCVRSDFFLGRIGSSLSWNVVYWRKVLADEYGLDRSIVDAPSWYSLANFTTTGAVRGEGQHLPGIEMQFEELN